MQSCVINFGLAQIVSTGNHMTSLVTKHVYVYCILDNVFGSPIFAFHDFRSKCLHVEVGQPDRAKSRK